MSKDNLWLQSQFFSAELAIYCVMIAATSIEVLVIWRHYFKLGFKATKAADKIWEEEENETIFSKLIYVF